MKFEKVIKIELADSIDGASKNQKGEIAYEVSVETGK